MAKWQNIGEKFKSILIVGLNRVELIHPDNTEPIFAENWQDLSDKQSRKSTALCLFSPHDLGGDSINPYAYLAAGIPAASEEEENENARRIEQELGDTAILDLCQIKEKDPNTVHFLVAADIIFHWDSKGAYVQPTNQQTWIRDLQQLTKGYLRTTQKNIYTEWDKEQLEPLKLSAKSVRECPLHTEAWINMPTFQEMYGTPVLLATLLFASSVAGALYLQNQDIQTLREEIQQVEAKMPRTRNLENLSKMLDDLNDQKKYRDLWPLVVKDVSLAIQTSGMQVEKFSIENHNPKTPPNTLLTTIIATQGVYKGWLQEEPIAKGLISHSISISDIRKAPTGAKYTLEGLIPMRKFEETINRWKQEEEEAS